MENGIQTIGSVEDERQSRLFQSSFVSGRGIRASMAVSVIAHVFCLFAVPVMIRALLTDLWDDDHTQYVYRLIPGGLHSYPFVTGSQLGPHSSQKAAGSPGSKRAVSEANSAPHRQPLVYSPMASSSEGDSEWSAVETELSNLPAPARILPFRDDWLVVKGQKGRIDGSTATAPVVDNSRNQDVAAAATSVRKELLPDGSIRMLHPVNGVHDIDLVQLSPVGLPLEMSDLLAGRTVHLVYLNVGTAKEWAFQYCLPEVSESSDPDTTRVIKLPAVETIRAPYPLVTVLPPPADRSRRRVILYSQLDAEGRFKNTRILDGQASRSLLDRLAEWVFRPARRDGVAVPVEVLLEIPPEPL